MRPSFKPYQQVVEVLRKDPGANQKMIVILASSVLVKTDTQGHLEQSRSLVACKERL